VKEVIIYSGGMDSYTLMMERRAEVGQDLCALLFNYGQRHVKELVSAAKACEKNNVAYQLLHLVSLSKVLQGSALTSDIPVPEGHYAEPSMKQTVVPNRNMIMLSVATGYAVSIGATAVYAGVHAGDHAIYPDCRPEFIAAMNQVTRIANYQAVEIKAPYLFLSKGDILRRGLAIPGTDYADTWTCYKGGEKACGKCGSCTERLESFAMNGVKDPLAYE
jgi:7-cyano-7-deazaguanine synthase